MKIYNCVVQDGVLDPLWRDRHDTRLPLDSASGGWMSLSLCPLDFAVRFHTLKPILCSRVTYHYLPGYLVTHKPCCNAPYYALVCPCEDEF